MEAKKFSSDEIINRLDELPTLPVIVYEMSKTINDPMSSTAEVENLMSKDQSLTTKVLKLVNSAYYAIPGGVRNLGRAIAYLGYDTVNQLVLSTSIFDALKVQESEVFNVREFWKHSLAVGVASETIAKFIHHPTPSDIFTCGLVHDMGKVAIYSLNPDSFIEVVRLANKGQVSFHEAEVQLELPYHTTIGFRLAQKWALPFQIQTVIKCHHEKDPARRGSLSHELNQCVDIVLLANLLVHALKFGNSGHSKVSGAPRDVIERLSINPDTDLKKIVLDIRLGLDRASDFLKVLNGG